MKFLRGSWLLCLIVMLFAVGTLCAQPHPPVPHKPGVHPPPVHKPGMHPPPHHKPGEKPHKPLTKDQVENRVKEFAKEKGLETKTNDDGRTVVIGKDGNEIPTDRILGPKPSPQDIERIENRLKEFAKEKGLETRTNADGRTVVIGKDGNEIPTDKILGHHPPINPKEIESRIEDYAKANGLKTTRIGRKLVALDENGKPVPLEQILGRPGEEKAVDDADDTDAATDDDEQAGQESTADDIDSPETAIDQTE